jgi:hypothetical protein
MIAKPIGIITSYILITAAQSTTVALNFCTSCFRRCAICYKVVDFVETTAHSTRIAFEIVIIYQKDLFVHHSSEIRSVILEQKFERKDF